MKAIDDYVNDLELLFADAVKNSCEVDNVGVIFSGGIDSTLVALEASKFSQVQTYSAGVADSEDINYVKRFINESDCIGKVVQFTHEDVELILAHIVKVLGKPDPLKVSVAVVFYFASKKASEDGLKVLLCGQGPDELFGGYNRYLRVLADGGYESLKEHLDDDSTGLFDSQLRYDVAICAANRVKLKFPFTDKKFVDYVMDIPSELKIKEVCNESEYSCVDSVDSKLYVRKYILRKLAEKIGVPEYIINRRKKAAQYGSKSEKILRNIAKSRGYKKLAADAGRTDYIRMYLESLV